MVKGEKKGLKKPSAKSANANGSRLRKLTRRQTKKVSKTKAQQRRLPGSFNLTRQVLQTFRTYWKPLGGIVLVYLVLNIIFASGISSISSTVSNIKDNLQASGGHH